MENIKLAVIGLGYVGLPLARLFATRYPVVGYDVKRERVAALMEGRDATQEVSDELLRSVLLPRLPEEGEAGLFCTSDAEQLRGCNYYIVAVPTPNGRWRSARRNSIPRSVSRRTSPTTRRWPAGRTIR